MRKKCVSSEREMVKKDLNELEDSKTKENFLFKWQLVKKSWENRPLLKE